jgi:prepilin-type processing-associated H-X9-DG protein
LLVVISIITVLISILLPALAAARAASRTTACLTTVRSIGQAATGFATDRKGQAPMAGRLADYTRATFDRAHLPGDLLYYEEAGAGSTERPMPFFASLASFGGAALETSSIQGMRDSLGASTSPSALAELAKLTRCPDDTEFTAGNTSHMGVTLGPGDTTWTVTTGLGEMSSYVVNEWVFGQEGSDRWRGKIERVQFPAEVFLACDGTPRVLESPPGQNYLLIWSDASQPGFSLSDYNDQNLGYTPETSTGFFYQFGYTVDMTTGEITGGPRHRKAINASFADGHGSTVPLTAARMKKVRISDP